MKTSVGTASRRSVLGLIGVGTLALLLPAGRAGAARSRAIKVYKSPYCGCCGAWTKILNVQGWAAPNWPVEFGGTGWNLIQRHIFDVACRQKHAPVLSGFGFNMVGPAIIKYGTEAQKQEFLPKIRNADLWFCQGYSEPGSGSDLASLNT